MYQFRRFLVLMCLGNPLSAILQCADEIVETLSEIVEEERLISKTDVLACIEAAQTIDLCAGHQKTIIEDILTVSKLDSSRLTITLVPTQPLNIAQNTIKMFQKEADKNSVMMCLKVTSREVAIYVFEATIYTSVYYGSLHEPEVYF